MDLIKQYPSLSCNAGNEAVFEIENFSAKLGLSVIDLIHLSRSCNRQTAQNLGARSGFSPEEILRLVQTAKQIFSGELKAELPRTHPDCISTGLKKLDECFSGGVPLGQVTEVFGASGCGKSQFLLSLAVEAQCSGEVDKNICIYISTEAALESRRLADFGRRVLGALDRVSYIYCPDLETQDHIIFTQLRAKLEENKRTGFNTRAVMIDSLGHHLRAQDTFLNTSQFFRSHLAWQEKQLLDLPAYRQQKVKFDTATNQFLKGDTRFRNRTSKKFYLMTLYSHLSELAKLYNVAIILANQVSDVMDLTETSFTDQTEKYEDEDPMIYDFQVGTFSGWNSTSFSQFDGLSDFEDSAIIVEGALQPGARKRKKTDGEQKNHIIEQDYLRSFDTRHIPGPKKKVSAMGYTWTKLAMHRILLWKSYRPVLRQSAQNSGGINDTCVSDTSLENHSNNRSTSQIDSQDGIEQIGETPTVGGFHVRRFARAISAYTEHAATAEFEISQTGIGPVHVT